MNHSGRNKFGRGRIIFKAKRRSIIVYFVICVSSLFYTQSYAALVTFNNDAPGVYANPFTSVDSPLVQFSEVGSGAVGSIGINPNQSTTNVLSSSAGGGAPDEILMKFFGPVTSLSFDIGQSSGFQGDGWLRVFDGTTQVAETRVALDSDTLFNQVISYSGPGAITSALYALVGTGSTDLGSAAESIDNLRFNVVPVPAAAWLFGTALIGLVGFSKRRKAA